MENSKKTKKGSDSVESYVRKNRLKEALRLRGMKQVELVEKTGIKKSSINNWIAQRWQPKQDALMKMASALNVSEIWLAGYDVDIERPVEEIRIDRLAKLVHRLKKDERLLKLSISICELDSNQLTFVETMINELTKIKSQN